MQIHINNMKNVCKKYLMSINIMFYYKFIRFIIKILDNQKIYKKVY